MKLLIAIALASALACQEDLEEPGQDRAVIADVGGVESSSQLDSRSQVIPPRGVLSQRSNIDSGVPSRTPERCPTTEQGHRELEQRDPVRAALCREQQSTAPH